MSRTARQRDKQKSILDSAALLFRQNGFYHVSIEDIVKAGGTSIATFYSYFGAKDEIVCAYRADALAACAQYYGTLVEDEGYAGLDGLGRVELFMGHILARLADLGVEFGSVFALRRIRQRDAVPEDKPYLPFLEELLAAGQEDGSVRRDRSPRLLAKLADRMLDGANLYWNILNGDRAAARDAGEVIALFCRIAGEEREREPSLFKAWQTAHAMLIPDPRAGIKRMEEDWLEQLR